MVAFCARSHVAPQHAELLAEKKVEKLERKEKFRKLYVEWRFISRREVYNLAQDRRLFHQFIQRLCSNDDQS